MTKENKNIKKETKSAPKDFSFERFIDEKHIAETENKARENFPKYFPIETLGNYLARYVASAVRNMTVYDNIRVSEFISFDEEKIKAYFDGDIFESFNKNIDTDFKFNLKIADLFIKLDRKKSRKKNNGLSASEIRLYTKIAQLERERLYELCSLAKSS